MLLIIVMCRYCLGYKNSDFDMMDAFKVHETAEDISRLLKKHEKALLHLKTLITDKEKIQEVDKRHKDIVRQRKEFNSEYYQSFLL
tara:strand:- start:153 stop:410 length:258 start_codon:yes stop_codon:yes gene_type:complete